MHRKLYLLLFAAWLCALFGQGANVCSLQCVREIVNSGINYTNVTISAVALTPVENTNVWIIQDKTGRLCIVRPKDVPTLRRGDRFDAKIALGTQISGEPWVQLSSYVRTGSEDLPPPRDFSLSDLDNPDNDLLSVRVTATIVSIDKDEIDANYVVALLKDGSSYLPLFMLKDDPLPPVGSKIRVYGTYYRSINGIRKFSGPFIDCNRKQTIEVLVPAPTDPFSARPLDRKLYLSPKEIAAMGPRTVSGVVIACWSERQAMVKEPFGRIVNITMAKDAARPAPLETGVFVGYPSTDLFRINLTRARFKQQDVGQIPQDSSESLTADFIVGRQWTTTHTTSMSTYHGHLLRLTGTVRSLPLEQSPEQRLYLDCVTHTVPVDISSCREVARRLPIGSEVEVTGRCWLDIDEWKPDNIFPQIRGFMLITRTADDIHVTRFPPWWTPARLMIVIGVILAVLLGAFAWVFTLHRLAERRGQALYRARQARDAERHTREIAEVRMQDRTRLAVELHDTISQNLTGASMQMGTAAQLIETDGAQAARHLDIATRTLVSCREELRNYIWGLRNNALDEPDLNAAIRTAIHRLMSGVSLQIRFNIPRERLSDNTVHALMRIIRELASNAVRHGEAENIRIAGTLDNDILRFSVTDDGKGFDPETRPGLAEGHFGLQGIEERVAELDGEMKITSRLGKGTRVSVWVKTI